MDTHYAMLLPEAQEIQIRAWFLGTRIDLRALERGETISETPLTVRAGERGYAVLFRYGVVVLVALSPIEEAAFLETVRAFVQGPFEEPESEDSQIMIDPNWDKHIGPDGRLILPEVSLERLQIIAHVLAKSTVLAHYEERVGTIFDRIENLAENLQRGAHRRTSGRELLREIGDVLLIQTRTVGRVEVTEKPELAWEYPELDRLYERLSIEYELHDRDLALGRKLDLISHTAQTYLSLLENRQGLRVEWYIVILIVVEIVLIVYDIFFPH